MNLSLETPRNKKDNIFGLWNSRGSEMVFPGPYHMFPRETATQDQFRPFTTDSAQNISKPHEPKIMWHLHGLFRSLQHMFQQLGAANTFLINFYLDAIQTNLDRCLQLDANIFESKNRMDAMAAAGKERYKYPRAMI